MNKDLILKLQKEIRFNTNLYVENHKKISELRIKQIELRNKIFEKENYLVEAYK